MSQPTNAVQFSATIAPDGWVHIYIGTHDLPDSSRQEERLPKLAIHIDGQRPHWFDHPGDWISKKPQQRGPIGGDDTCKNPS